MSERDVVFRLRSVVGDDARKGFGDFKQHLSDIRRQIEGAERSAASSVLLETERAKGAILSLRDLARNMSAQIRVPRQTITPPVDAAAPTAAVPRQTAAAHATSETDALRRKQLLAAMKLEDNTEAESKSTKDLENIWRARQRVVSQFYAHQRKERAEAERDQIRVPRQTTAPPVDAAAPTAAVPVSAVPRQTAAAHATSETDTLRRKQLLAAMKLENSAEAEGKSTKDLEGIWRARQRVVSQFYAHQRKERAEAERDQERADKEQLRSLEKIAREADRLATQKSRAASKAAVDEQRSIKTLENERERALSRSRGATDQFYERLTSATEGIGRFGRGLATLGVLGEKSTDGLIRGLAKAQAAFDVFTGAVKTIRDVQKAVEAWRAATSAAAAAQELGRAATTRAAASSAELTAALAAEKVAADAATAAHARLAAARATSTAAGAGKGAVGLLSNLGGLGGLGRMFGGMGAGGGSLAGAGSAAAAAAPWVAAGVGLAAAGTVSFQTGGDIARYGFMGGARPGSLTDKIATQEAKLANLFGLTPGLAESQAGVSRLEKQRAEILERTRHQQEVRESETERSALRAAANSEEWSLRDRVLDAKGERGYRRELSKMRTVRDDLAPDTPHPEREAVEKRIADIHGKIADMAKERLETEKRTAETRKQSLQDTIRGLQDELKQRKEAQREAEDTYKSGKERFGSLDPVEQAKLIALKRRADEAAGDATDPRERAQRAAMALTRQERERLASVDTEFTRSVQSEGNRQAADRMGYDKFFAAEERRKIQTEQKAQQRLSLELKDKRQLEVKIEDDVNELARQVSNTMQAHLARRDKILVAQVRAELDRMMQRQDESDAKRQASRRNM